MKYFFILLTFSVCSQLALAQSAEDSVKMVINQMFAGMKNADAALVKSTFSDSVIFQSIATAKDGTVKVVSEDPVAFLDFIGKQARGAADERIVFETVKIDGDLAIAWTPYTFYYNGKFSHCGVDSFQLVRVNGRWKIQYIIDTRRRQGCE